MSDTVSAHNAQESTLVERYGSVSAGAARAAPEEFIPYGRDQLAFDIGAGSGRTTARLVSLEHEMV